MNGVLFDAVGTLFELREGVGSVYARVARRYGVELPAARIDAAFGRILARAPARVFREAATREEWAAGEREWWREVVRGTFRAVEDSLRFRDFEGCFGALFAHYGDAGAWVLRSGARQSLEALRDRGLCTGVVSNFDFRLPGVLDGLGIAELLDSVTLPGDCGAEKPDPRIFEMALGRLGLTRDEVVYVGNDPVRDLVGARAAGLRSLDARGISDLRELPARIKAIANLGAP